MLDLETAIHRMTIDERQAMLDFGCAVQDGEIIDTVTGEGFELVYFPLAWGSVFPFWIPENANWIINHPFDLIHEAVMERNRELDIWPFNTN